MAKRILMLALVLASFTALAPAAVIVSRPYVYHPYVRPVVREWRLARGLPAEPLKALAESGYVERIAKERASKNARSVSSYA